MSLRELMTIGDTPRMICPNRSKRQQNDARRPRTNWATLPYFHCTITTAKEAENEGGAATEMKYVFRLAVASISCNKRR